MHLDQSSCDRLEAALRVPMVLAPHAQHLLAVGECHDECETAKPATAGKRRQILRVGDIKRQQLLSARLSTSALRQVNDVGHTVPLQAMRSARTAAPPK